MHYYLQHEQKPSSSWNLRLECHEGLKGVPWSIGLEAKTPMSL